MKTAYLHCFSGISGDMFLGALVDAGADLELLRRTIQELNIGAELRVSRVNRSGISCTKADVVTNKNPHQHHDHNHEHGHDQRTHKHAHTHGRSLRDIRSMIERLPIPVRSKDLALRAFQMLGEAEVRIHNLPIEEIHFHEVGAVDSIVDIVGGAVAAESLGIEKWICSPLNVGGGMVKCAHGVFPVPAPAALELLKSIPVYSGEVQQELVTPTGAALVRALRCEFSRFPAMQVESTGYGAGTQEFDGHPNALRLCIGQMEDQPSPMLRRTITVIETSIDDTNPQVLGYVSEKAYAMGALDLFASPVQMKKNRQGILVTLLCKNEDAYKMCELLFRETTTLGLRVREEDSIYLDREIITVQSGGGDVRIKIGRFDGAIVNAAPEYEDCRAIAEKFDIPLKRVQREAIQEFEEQYRHSSAANS